MIKRSEEVYCIFGNAKERVPQFALVEIKHGPEGIKLVDDLPGRGLRQLIQLNEPEKDRMPR